MVEIHWKRDNRTLCQKEELHIHLIVRIICLGCYNSVMIMAGRLPYTFFFFFYLTVWYINANRHTVQHQYKCKPNMAATQSAHSTYNGVRMRVHGSVQSVAKQPINTSISVVRTSIMAIYNANPIYYLLRLRKCLSCKRLSLSVYTI